MMRAVVGFCVVLLVCAVPAYSADWPQYLGPGASGVSPEKELARSWPADGPRVVWSREVGEGYGGAAVRDGKVFILDRPDDKQDVLRCLDLASGKELWSFAYSAPGRMQYPGSRNIPTVDEKFVYTMSAYGQLHCVDRDTHQLVWARHIIKDFPDIKAEATAATRPGDRQWMRPITPKWGVTQNPILYKNLVIVAPQTVSTGMVAYEKATGQIAWKSPYVGRNWFSHPTPYLARFHDTDQVILLANKHWGNKPPAVISSVEAATGKLLWQLETWKRYNMPIPRPLALPEDRLFVTGGYTIGCFSLKIRRDGPTWWAEYLFRDNDNCTSHIQSPILWQNHIYGQSYDGYHNETNHGLVCLDLDGNLKWKSDQHYESGNLVIADGLIYVMHGRTGELHLVEASPRAYKVLARAKVLEARGNQAWAPMAISDGKLIVRDLHQMKCLDIKAR